MSGAAVGHTGNLDGGQQLSPWHLLILAKVAWFLSAAVASASQSHRPLASFPGGGKQQHPWRPSSDALPGK